MRLIQKRAYTYEKVRETIDTPQETPECRQAKDAQLGSSN